MRLVVGYDRGLAEQCFKRNLNQLVTSSQHTKAITPMEVNYVAERLSETSVFGLERRLGNPWVVYADVKKLLNTQIRFMTRTDFLNCELIANNAIFVDGLVSRIGVRAMNYEQLEALRKKNELIRKLYRKASASEFHNEEYGEVLVAMSKHVAEWVRCLSFFPGHDFQDLLSTLSSYRFE